MTYQDILKTIPITMSARLAVKNLKKKKKAKDFLDMGVEI